MYVYVSTASHLFIYFNFMTDLKKRPTDAGLQGFLNNSSISNLYEDIAIALGVPSAQVKSCGKHSNSPGVESLKYWTNGNIKRVPTTWEYLFEKVAALKDFGPNAVESVKIDVAANPLWSHQ